MTGRKRWLSQSVRASRTPDIAVSLDLTVPTVKACVSAILTKFGFNNRVQIALLAHDAGLLGEP
jgi:DNA-binding NarL/FixJ family response regulator